MALNEISDSWTKFVDVQMSRDEAKRTRKKIIAEKGKAVVDRTLMAKIKQYSRDVFGSTSYWPWLAYYTELRGEFIEGWIPEDYYRFELLPEINPEKFIRFSEAKTIDHKIFNGFIIEPLLFRSSNQYYDKDGAFKTKVEVQRLLSDFDDEIVIKPENGRGGQLVIFKHSSELKLEELPAHTNLLFQKAVTQHPELNRLYPDSINTFRVMSYLDKDGEVKIKFIIMRFGTGGSRIDNCSNGGRWIYIQQDGTPEPMSFDQYGIPMGTVHPDTGIKFADLKLPFLSKIMELCKKAHGNFPYTRIIGWDVFVNENEEAKLIEWNANNPFWGAIEAHFGPFLKEVVNSKRE